MKISVKISSIQDVSADCFIVPLFQSEGGDKGKPIIPKEVKELESLVSDIVASKAFIAKLNTTLFLRNTRLFNSKNILLAGLGEWKSDYLSNIYGAAKCAGSLIRCEKLKSATVYIPGFCKNKKDLNDHTTTQIAVGFLDSTYEFNEYKTEKEPIPFNALTFFSDQKSDEKYLKAGIENGEKIFQGLKLAKDLCNTPPNDLSPDKLVNWGKKATSQFGVKATIFDRNRLEKEKMGGILGVGQGSKNEPRLLVLEYKGPKATSKVCLVGKGVTFDTGGINIKPSPKMEDMKYDMSGSAIVLGTTLAAASLKLPIHLIAVVPSAENMPSGTSYRPSDVIKMHSGKTVEINNTDAEGRLILADALSYAHSFKPDVIVDSATLTGGVVIALGTVAAGVMGNSDEYIRQIKSAGENVGEKVWHLPLYDEYKEDLQSGIADYRNSGGREASPSKGGTFLNFFIQKEQPWVHIDIAGVAWAGSSNPSGNCASGWGVRLLVDFLANFKTIKTKK